jgi:16S rRNA (uracil1498-N3)-methyltransferase
MDLILRQGTELVVHRFIPLLTRRSISRPDIAQYGHKKSRWQKIVVEACRQCGRDDIPGLDPVTKWEKALELFREFDLVLMAYEKDAPTLQTVLESAPRSKKILILIGPEGGWTKEEAREAEQGGAAPVHFPTPILRTETAGIAATAMIQFFFSHRMENETT